MFIYIFKDCGVWKNNLNRERCYMIIWLLKCCFLFCINAFLESLKDPNKIWKQILVVFSFSTFISFGISNEMKLDQQEIYGLHVKSMYIHMETNWLPWPTIRNWQWGADNNETTTKEMISIFPLWTFHLYIATFQQLLHMVYISLSWYDIPEFVIPIRISLIDGYC